MSAEALPTFAKPPVVETVFGVQFEPLPGFTLAHLGAFWEALGGRQKWPKASDAPALESEFERFGEERTWVPLNAMRLFGPFLVGRMQLSSDDRMIQVQNSRVMYNWIGKSGTHYPRYDVLRAEFDSIFSNFKRFVEDYSLGGIVPNQWEVVYVNHLPRGTVWHHPSDWSRVFDANAMLPANLGDTSLQDFNGRWSYDIPNKGGRLHVSLNHGFEKPGGSELLVLNLTARGPIADGEGSVPRAEDGLELGRRSIVKGFQTLMSSDARLTGRNNCDAHGYTQEFPGNR